MWRDVRYAWRTLMRARGFTIVAVTILGIGLGASITIFSVLNGVLLRPLPYSDPDRLVAAWEVNRAELEVRSGVSAALFEVMRAQEGVFSGVAAWRAWGYELGGTAEPERLQGARVSANLFELLGVRALAGRTFGVGDDAPGAPPVALLGEELWRRRFGGDSAMIGRDLELNGQLHTVVGIIPAGHMLPAAEVWVPLILAQYELDQRGNRSLSVVARLAEGVEVAAARAAVDAAVTRVTEDFPAHAGWNVAVEELHHVLSAGTRGPLLALFSATCLLLLAACGNLASLLLARSAARRREIALRVALGAGKWRIVRQLVTESTLLVTAAAALGLWLGDAGNSVLFGLAAAWLPAGTTVSIDATVILFVAGLTLVAGVALAAIPALEAVRLDLNQHIRTAGSAPRRGSLGLRDVTAVGQVMLALLLLVGGALLLRSFLQVQRVEPGFDARDVVAMTMSLPARYGPEQRAEFYATLEQRLAAMPMARGAALASHLPLAGGLLVSDFDIEGRPGSDPSAMTAHLMTVTAGYFAALRIPVLAGRAFTTADRLNAAPVVIIDAEFARRHWPAGDALGRRVRLGATLGADTHWREIVGIVASVRAVSLEQPAEPTLYIPHAQNPWPSLTLVIRSNGTAAATVTRHAVAIVHELDPSRPVYAMRSLHETVQRLLAPRRLQTMLMGGFAVAALVLAVLGVYGMLAHAVTQRSRELGVRMALGARRREIVRLCVQRGLARVALGLLLGLLAALAMARLLDSLLFGLAPWDPLAYVGAVTLLLVAGLASCMVPALRAARLNPVDVLRHD
ncbi:MAG TPA: ABC transporter permease [Longimicrobiales bacterium]|nr:ABC transporter permease [Longimicrobiales bacterium]